ncbi:hypothetical protein QCA50_001781 [Cerrena zonata]|uniref:Uncharacterized protein n=1 Tax=Cerrena zonata TaxID=2478898 RepID=A0AAW0GTY7_9APHY
MNVGVINDADTGSYDPTNQINTPEADPNYGTVIAIGVGLIFILVISACAMWTYFTKSARYAIINRYRQMRGKEPKSFQDAPVISRPTLVSSTGQLPSDYAVPSLSYSLPEVRPTIAVPARVAAGPPKSLRYPPRPLAKIGSSSSGKMSRQESKGSETTTSITKPASENPDTTRSPTFEQVVMHALPYQENNPGPGA